MFYGLFAGEAGIKELNHEKLETLLLSAARHEKKKKKEKKDILFARRNGVLEWKGFKFRRGNLQTGWC